MDTNLFGKNIILISPRFFNYETEIKTALEKKGAHVYYINDRIKDSTFNKALFRLNLLRKRGKKRVFKYFDDHLKQSTNEKKIDYLITIVPEGFSKEIIEYYKSKLTDAIFILYMWDSIKNRPYILETLSLYERSYTFDKSDSENHHIAFRPLFYTDEYYLIGQATASFKYDLSFIGTAHSDRYAIITKLVKSTSKKLNTFFFFYLQHPLIAMYYKLTDSQFKNVKIKDISFTSLSKQNVLKIIEGSICVVDINHPKQTGLTIRTLEVLGARRKLITTNNDIVNYDFYDANNILVIERQNPNLTESFLTIPYKPLNVEIYNRYSISSWVNEVLAL